MKHLSYLTLCVVIPVMSACADNQDDYPALMPTDQLLAEPKLSPAASAPEATTENVESKADALRARADALRQPVIDPETRRRMEQQ